MTTNLCEDVANWNFYTCWWECKLVQPLWKTLWRFLKNIKLELPYDPLILLLGIYAKEHKTGYNRGTCTPMFIEALLKITQLWNQPTYPTTDECIRKCGIYIHRSFTQPEGIMTCGLKVNGYNWKTSC
jgi:hypothetical protein